MRKEVCIREFDNQSVLSGCISPICDYLHLLNAPYDKLWPTMAKEVCVKRNLKLPDENFSKQFLQNNRSILQGYQFLQYNCFQQAFPLDLSGMWKAGDGGIGMASASISDDPFNTNFIWLT